MATRRRAATPQAIATRSRARRSSALVERALTPDVVRSIVGLILLVLGAMTLIALVLPGQGALTELVDATSFAPWFGTDALAAAVLPARGRLVPRMGTRQAAGLGLGDHAARPRDHLSLGLPSALSPGVRDLGAAAVGSAGSLESILAPLLTAPGAFVLLVGLVGASAWCSASGSRCGSSSTRPSAPLAGSASTAAEIDCAGRRPKSADRRPAAAEARRERRGTAGPRARPSPCRPTRRRARPASGATTTMARSRSPIPSPRPTSATFAPARGTAVAATAGRARPAPRATSTT